MLPPLYFLSFRDGPKDQTRNLEIPGLNCVRPGMTKSFQIHRIAMHGCRKSSPRTVQKTVIANQPESGTFRACLTCPLEAKQQRRVPMGATTDKAKGTANEAIGKAKQGVGEAIGSDKLQGEGAVQEIKGKGQKAVGDAKQATKDAVNKAAAAANKNL
jgi:uncharacterized protein YjbJ (UPF0337 family)